MFERFFGRESSIKKIDISGPKQKERGRQNFLVEHPDGRQQFEKNVENKPDRDHVGDLLRERFLLGKLESSGMTPRVEGFTQSSDGQRATLTLEVKPGNSFFKSEMRRPEMKKRADEIIEATANNLDYLHKQGIVLGDINDGTFLIDDRGDTIKSYLVDLETGVDFDSFDDEEKKRLYAFYQRKEPVMKRNQVQTHEVPTIEQLKQADIGMWAHTIAEWLMRGETEKRKGFSQESIDLQEELKQRGISLTPEHLGFLQRAISDDLEHRPDNFDELFEHNQ